jgi:CheY-like chemotaxis protein
VPNNAPLRILVVDDLRDGADTLALLLEVMGHQALAVYDGPSALQAAGRFRPQVVLLDLGLPHMTGYEVAGRLRQVAGCEHTLIAAVTGYGRDEDRRRTQEAGFDAHLLKPVEPDQLIALLGQCRPSQRPFDRHTPLPERDRAAR